MKIVDQPAFIHTAVIWYSFIMLYVASWCASQGWGILVWMVFAAFLSPICLLHFKVMEKRKQQAMNLLLKKRQTPPDIEDTLAEYLQLINKDEREEE